MACVLAWGTVLPSLWHPLPAMLTLHPMHRILHAPHVFLRPLFWLQSGFLKSSLSLCVPQQSAGHGSNSLHSLQQPASILQSSPPGAFRRVLTCVALALVLGAALVAGGLAIGVSKGGKGDAEVQNPNDTVSSVSASTAERSIIVHDSIATVGDNSKVRGGDTDADVYSNALTLQHSVDAYLRSIHAAKAADTNRKQGFEIKATESPQPLLEQPHAAQVSTDNFKYNYLEAWFKSMLMFEIQRGGTQVLFPIALCVLHTPLCLSNARMHSSCTPGSVTSSISPSSCFIRKFQASTTSAVSM